MAKQPGNKPKKKLELNVSKHGLLLLFERWMTKFIFVVAIIGVVGSLLLTMQHLQSNMGATELQQKITEQIPDFKDILLSVHQEKINLPDLDNERLRSPF